MIVIVVWKGLKLRWALRGTSGEAGNVPSGSSECVCLVTIVVSFEIRKCDPSNFALLLQDCFIYSGSLAHSYKF